MRILLSFLLVLSVSTVFSQFHDYNISKITDINEAKAYASRYREVSFGIVNAHNNPFLFDDIDTSNMKNEVGNVRFIYNRGTKFLKDTTLTMTHIQVVEFNTNVLSEDSIAKLKVLIQQRMNEGVGYWMLQREFRGEGIRYTSQPVNIDDIDVTYNVEGDSLVDMGFQWWETTDHNRIGWIIMDENPVKVPAFYSISYLKAG